jgi:hypothetical protein
LLRTTNVAITGPGIINPINAGWPALALLIAVELLSGMPDDNFRQALVIDDLASPGGDVPPWHGPGRDRRVVVSAGPAQGGDEVLAVWRADAGHVVVALGRDLAGIAIERRALVVELVEEVGTAERHPAEHAAP